MQAAWQLLYEETHMHTHTQGGHRNNGTALQYNVFQYHGPATHAALWEASNIPCLLTAHCFVFFVKVTHHHTRLFIMFIGSQKRQLIVAATISFFKFSHWKLNFLDPSQ